MSGGFTISLSIIISESTIDGIFFVEFLELCFPECDY